MFAGTEGPIVIPDNVARKTQKRRSRSPISHRSSFNGMRGVRRTNAPMTAPSGGRDYRHRVLERTMLMGRSRVPTARGNPRGMDSTFRSRPTPSFPRPLHPPASVRNRSTDIIGRQRPNYDARNDIRRLNPRPTYESRLPHKDLREERTPNFKDSQRRRARSPQIFEFSRQDRRVERVFTAPPSLRFEKAITRIRGNPRDDRNEERYVRPQRIREFQAPPMKHSRPTTERYYPTSSRPHNENNDYRQSSRGRWRQR